jgi:hypothetical protein
VKPTDVATTNAGKPARKTTPHFISASHTVHPGPGKARTNSIYLNQSTYFWMNDLMKYVSVANFLSGAKT